MPSGYIPHTHAEFIQQQRARQEAKLAKDRSPAHETTSAPTWLCRRDPSHQLDTFALVLGICECGGSLAPSDEYEPDPTAG